MMPVIGNYVGVATVAWALIHHDKAGAIAGLAGMVGGGLAKAAFVRLAGEAEMGIKSMDYAADFTSGVHGFAVGTVVEQWPNR